MDQMGFYNNGKWRLNINRICRFMGIEVPECFRSDETLCRRFFYGLRLNFSAPKPYNFLLFFNNGGAPVNSVKKAIDQGAIVVSDMDLIRDDGTPYNYIRIDNPLEQALRLGRYMKESFPMPTIAITGSVGKSTTTLFANAVFSERYNPFLTGLNGTNLNIASSVLRMAYNRYDDRYDFHIQESGAGVKRHVENMAKILNVDAYAITTIEPVHLDNYGTLENICYDKTSFDRISKPDCVGFINKDNEVLKNWKYEKKIRTIAIYDETADYVGKNIHQNGEWLEFDVDDHTHLTHIKIQIPGVHNVYNALLVFGLAKNWGFTDEEIQRGFLKYHSLGVRQNIIGVAGRTLYIDCFNIAAKSMLSCCKTLAEMDIAEGATKIAVMGGENRHAENGYKVNFNTGVLVGEQYGDKIDYFVCIGLDREKDDEETNLFGNARGFYAGLCSVLPKERVCFISDVERLADILADTKPGDVCMFKCNYRFPLIEAIDKTFGTSLFYRNNAEEKQENFQSGDFMVSSFEDFGICTVFDYKGNESIPVIPNAVSNAVVTGLGKNTFKGKTEIKEVKLGRFIENIGTSAFEESGIKNLILPASVKCIEADSFKNCKNLEYLLIGDACKTIAIGAFDGCEKLTVVASEGSYAARFAAENGITCISPRDYYFQTGK